MALLIDKEYVSDYVGEIVYLETNFIDGDNGLVSIVSFSYRPDMDLHAVEIVGFNEHAEYYLEDYDKTWRLWDVFVEMPSIQQRNHIPWETK